LPNIVSLRAADERARRDHAADAAISSGDRRLWQWKRLAAPISGALHCGARYLGAEDRRLRHTQSRRCQGGGGSLDRGLANRQAAFAHDGMPIGIKDIIETIDMPTENGSPLLLIHRIDGPQIGPILAVCGDVRLDIIKPTASGGLPLATDAHPWKIELLAFHSRAPLSLARVKSSQARSFANE